MKPGAGKAKGGAFERLICKQLSLWVSNNKRDDIFWRSAMSGGRATVQAKKGKKNLTQQGDITAIDPSGDWLTKRFIIECKNYKNLHITSLIYQVPKTNSIIEFIAKLTELSETNNKYYLLIAKQNNTPFTLLFTNCRKFSSVIPIAAFTWVDGKVIYLFNLDTFLSTITIKKVKTITYG